jgi:hypothetical protein
LQGDHRPLAIGPLRLPQDLNSIPYHLAVVYVRQNEKREYGWLNGQLIALVCPAPSRLRPAATESLQQMTA